MPFGISCVCAQLCPSLCDPMDCSPPGSSVYGFPGQEYQSGLPFPSPFDISYKAQQQWLKKKNLKWEFSKGLYSTGSMQKFKYASGLICGLCRMITEPLSMRNDHMGWRWSHKPSPKGPWHSMAVWNMEGIHLNRRFKMPISVEDQWLVLQVTTSNIICTISQPHSHNNSHQIPLEEVMKSKGWRGELVK